jgi:hypothetical protein
VRRPRWKAPEHGPADLRAIRLVLNQRLGRARMLGIIPDRHPHFQHRRTSVLYRVAVTRDLQTGRISAGVRVEQFDWLIPAPRTTADTCRWLMDEGLALVAEVDRVLGREQFDPPLGGRTLLIPDELGLEPPRTWDSCPTDMERKTS